MNCSKLIEDNYLINYVLVRLDIFRTQIRFLFYNSYNRLSACFNKASVNKMFEIVFSVFTLPCFQNSHFVAYIRVH